MIRNVDQNDITGIILYEKAVCNNQLNRRYKQVVPCDVVVSLVVVKEESF